jgi:CelD/BcsL family acetyltransferase involved in cellulose biosynthesis
MIQPSLLTFDAGSQHIKGRPRPGTVSQGVCEIPNYTITSDLSSLEDEWRCFEQGADCTPFQTFDWLSTWQRCIGSNEGVTPIIVVARRETGDPFFLLPLSVRCERFLTPLTFLGHKLCDYNAPLLAPDFSQKVSAASFLTFWKQVQVRLRQTYKFDFVLFDKMPKIVGSQPNPMSELSIMPNASGAHETQLGTNWEQFYLGKRSSATRRNDRKKRNKLAEFGEVRFVTADTPKEINTTFATLVAQKSRKFRQMGVSNLFARTGHKEFFLSMAREVPTLVHVSALRVGSITAAANLGLKFRDRYYHILASHEEGPMSHFGPGAAHLHELMRHAIEQGLARFDFTIGDEPYKLNWADRKAELFDHVRGIGPIGRAGEMVIKAILRVKRFAKNSPTIWKWTRELRRALTSMRVR